MARKPFTSGLGDDPLWYQQAVIYQLHVRSFFDGDGDGIGDFVGLTEKLDYLQELGVTALWMLPFYPSPLRDGGYDISDYHGINPEYGTMSDFRRLVREAHARGLRVITEVVINHTSDQHEWFQRSRRAAPGTKWRDFYVWSDDRTKYSGARVIFSDFESSNWTWDEVAGAYYWHRFYHHQPDLNYDNPAVHNALLKVIDFWLSTGVDGLRLDAVPYLYEQEGTTCENLPATHDFLKKLRRHVDANFPNRMLLAEANQWPEDTRDYFGQGEGDECHMAFNFPVMPRMYMAVNMEDRYPLVDILHQTPQIPRTAQWALFLRNHDELTLEMVTDEERDYMYRVFASDPRARINLGIRRRLAPLQNNNRPRIELLNGLLMSLPGTPIIYYGDEIGMGDNIYLGDRDGVRTPMQWSADRNAGFSTANPQQLCLPVNIDPEYRYESVNVSAQHSNPSSLLVWMRQLISLRKRHPVFGNGQMEVLHPANPKVLSFIRFDDEEAILVVANLSRFPQYTELDLSHYRGRIPVEAFGGTRFPAIGDLPYLLTLAPHTFMWLRLEVPGFDEGGNRRAMPIIEVSRRWQDIVERPSERAEFERVLPRVLAGRPWFNPKQRTVVAARITDSFPIPREGAGSGLLILVEITYAEGEPDTYQVPLVLEDPQHSELLHYRPAAGLVAVSRRGEAAPLGAVIDAVHDPLTTRSLLKQILKRRRSSGADGRMQGVTTPAARAVPAVDIADWHPQLHRGPHRNTGILYNEHLHMKLHRRLDVGDNPDWELGRFLTDETSFAHVPPTLGALELHTRDGRDYTLALLQQQVASESDGWQYSVHRLGSFIEDLYGVIADHRADQLMPTTTLAGLDDKPVPDIAHEMLGPFLANAQLIGQRLAELHLALASSHSDPDLTSEPFPAHYQRQLYQAARAKIRAGIRALQSQAPRWSGPASEPVQRLLDAEDSILRALDPLKALRISGLRMRTHGDMRLGQILMTGPDVVFVDFEGRPTRFISQRRVKRSPLRDLAGLMRSVDTAAFVALSDHITRFNVSDQAADRVVLERGARFASSWAGAVMARAYIETAEATLLTEGRASSRVLLRSFLLEKAAIEIRGNLRSHPEHVLAPVAAMLRILAEVDSSGPA